MNAPVASGHNPFQITGSAGGLVSIEQQRAIAEVQAAMIVARSMPRSQPRAVDRILQECTNMELAEEASYAYNRGGSEVEAPSIRLAETIARHWGNLKTGVRELSRHDGYSECKAYAQDLETGYEEERTFQVRHWRDTRQGGYQLNDERDIYELVANMGARRKRACILALIPLDVQSQAMRECAKTLATDGEITGDRIEAMLAKFAEFKVSREMIERRIGRSLDSVPAVVFRQLQRIFNSLRDRMSDVEQWFDVAPAAAEPAKEDKSAGGRLRKAATKKKGDAKKKGDGGPQASAAPSVPAAAGAAVVDPSVVRTPDTLLADVKRCCGKALGTTDGVLAKVALDDARDLSRALEGQHAADAKAAIDSAAAELAKRFEE